MSFVPQPFCLRVERWHLGSEPCASSLSYLARFIIRKYPIGRFDGVASDLVARRDAMKSLAGSGRKYYDFCGRWGFDEAQAKPITSRPQNERRNQGIFMVN